MTNQGGARPRVPAASSGGTDVHAIVTVTCSFGVAEHHLGADERELIASADRALYRAKREGKNRVELDAGVRSF